MNFLSTEQIFRLKQPGERVSVLLRHAERRHITPDDADHGSYVPLTDKGREQALAAGKELSVFQGPMFFGSSPVFRCRETAARIAQAMGCLEFSEPEKVTPLQPLAEFYVNDDAAYMRHLNEGFYPAICKWIADGELSGFAPVREGSESLLKFILENSVANFNLFCSHDAWIVPFISHFAGIKFNPDLWLNFLSGMVIFYRPENPLKSARFFPVKFIDDGFLAFSQWKATKESL